MLHIDLVTIAKHLQTLDIVLNNSLVEKRLPNAIEIKFYTLIWTERRI